MASHEAVTEATCLVCFETRPLKIVGNCKHAFCTECLSSVLESQDSRSEVFACPSCKVKCPRPWDGVQGLVDFTENVTDNVAEAAPAVVPKRSAEKKTDWHVVEIKCKVCQHRKKEVLAVNLCAACGNFYFCRDCTATHARNKATQHHVVTPLHPEEKEDVAICEKHDTDLTSYCKTCDTAVCTICIMLDHGDHAIEDIRDMISAKETEVRNMLEEREKKLTEMLDLKADLTHLKVIAPLVDKQDILIKKIEDHAEKCISKIVKWKEDQKRQAKSYFKVIHDIPVGLGKVFDVVQKLQKPVNQATQLLTIKSSQHPAYLNKLISMQQHLEAIAETGDDMGGEKCYRGKVYDLHRNSHSFIAQETPSSFGYVKEEKAPEEFKPVEIFKHTMQVDHADMFIPCVANLGKTYAVAHPVRKGEPSNAIDIYEFSGRLIKTMSDNIPPFYDITSTLDGKLAVLTDAASGTGCSVQVFDQKTGHKNSTCDIDVGKPISIAVTVQGQYVVLDYEQGQQHFTIADINGIVKLKHDIRQPDLDFTLESQRFNRITCGGRCIYVCGNLHAYIFVLRNTTIAQVNASREFGVTDFSANICESFFSTVIHKGNQLGLVRYLPYQDKGIGRWRGKRWHVCDYVTGADMEARISERDGHIVLSHGQTIRVYRPSV